MNKKQIISGLLMTVITQLIGGGLKNHIVSLVRLQLGNTEFTGPEKKAEVLRQLSLLRGDLLIAIEKAGSYFVSAAVDIAVAYVKSRLAGAK